MADLPGGPLPGHQARGLSWRWHDRSPDRQDAGPRESAIETSLLEVLDASGRRVGHLRASFTTPALVAAAFHRPLAWAEENRGWSIGWRGARRGWREEPAPAEVWAKAHLHSGTDPVVDGRRVPHYNATERLAPSCPALVEKDLAVIERPLAEQMRAWTRWQSTPYVAYAHVDEHGADGQPLRGTGVGAAMYAVAGRCLAARGLVLSASGLQSPQAERVWQRLAADPAVPTRVVTKTNPRTGGRDRRLALDFRGLPSRKRTAAPRQDA